VVNENTILVQKSLSSPDSKKPFQVYSDDFDDSGSTDIILAYNNEDKLVPVRGRDCSSEQMPFITEKFPTFKDFAQAEIKDIVGDKIDSSLNKKAFNFASVILINEGGKLEQKLLPSEAQLFPINASEVHDFNQDGNLDILIAGNMYQTEAETSRADAGYGLVLLNDGEFNYKPLPLYKSGFFAPGDVKDMIKITLKDENPIFLIANNNAPSQAYQFVPPVERETLSSKAGKQ